MLLLGWLRHTQKFFDVQGAVFGLVQLSGGGTKAYLFSWCQAGQGTEIGCICYHHGLW